MSRGICMCFWKLRQVCPTQRWLLVKGQLFWWAGRGWDSHALTRNSIWSISVYKMMGRVRYEQLGRVCDVTLCRRLNNTSRSSRGICCIVINSENCVFRLEINENFFFLAEKIFQFIYISSISLDLMVRYHSSNRWTIFSLIKRILFRIIITLIPVPPQHPVLYGSTESWS